MQFGSIEFGHHLCHEKLLYSIVNQMAMVRNQQGVNWLAQRIGSFLKVTWIVLDFEARKIRIKKT